MFDQTKCFCDIEDTARILSLVPAYVRRLCKLGKIIGAVKEAGKWKISLAGIHEYEARQGRGS